MSQTMKLIPVLLGIFMPLTAFGEWTPPDNPNLQAILQETRADTVAGRYEEALAKHVWFHRNALKHDPAMAGVRLSFALSYWDELAQKYPPALTQLKEVRDEARKNVGNAKPAAARAAFQEFAAINKTLGEESETKTLFASLDDQQSPLAKDVFTMALPALLKAKEYPLCGKYVEPETALANSVKHFRMNLKSAKEPRLGGAQLRQFAEKKFTNDTAIIIAILVLNDRKKEADEVAAEAKKEWNDKAFHAALDKALDGVVPQPWP